MIRYLRDINDPSIWEELKDVIGERKSILLANLGFSTSSPAQMEIHPPTSWENLLEEIIKWCTEHVGFSAQERLSSFLINGHLEEIRFRDTISSIEEFLQEENKRACFKRVLLCDQVEEAEVPGFLLNQSLHEYLCPDKKCEEFIKRTYVEAAKLSLNQCYKTSLQDAIEACRTQKPFVFELYNHVNEPVPTALDFNNEVLKSLSDNSDIYWKDLRKLLTDASTLFMQFDVTGLEAVKHPNRNDNLCRWLITKKGHILQMQAEKLWNRGQGISTIIYNEIDELVSFIKRLAVPSIEIYIAYAREDKTLQERLKKHLIILQREMVDRCNIAVWDESEITAGMDWQKEFKERMKSAHVILLLVSADFLASDVGKDSNQSAIEKAMERHDDDKARVIPILLRPCRWQGAKFARLHVLPPDQKPVTKWEDPDEAFTEIVEEMSKAIDVLLKPSSKSNTYEVS